ncbi:MAG: hypothetical protein A2V91_03605, partial [Candidatus Muproteobacteria bacterium RBG_16_64_10]
LLTFADIVLLTVLMHASGGLGSGLGLLLVVAVGGGSLLLSRLITIFYASLASIAVILEHSWGYLTGNVTSLAALSQDYPQVGMLGIGFFVTAFLGYTLAERLRATEALAERRGVDLANLTQVNALVIQHMQIGVLVSDADGNIRLGNQAAQKFLGQALASGKLPPLTTVSPDLAIQLFRWLGDDARDGGRSGPPGPSRGITPSLEGRGTTPGTEEVGPRREQRPSTAPGAVAEGRRGRSVFTTRTGYTVLPRFVALGEDKAAGALIFLEDMAVLKQQAQQLKMASLARLTASIAHEIRNPLGALANAAQLLGEAAQPNDQEKRLIKIIGDQSRRMNVIVENVTQLSRRDHVRPARFVLDPWLGEFTRQYADTARVAHEIFTLSEHADGVEVCMDPEQLYQVVSNLCQNALRHSPPFTGTPLIRLDTGHDPEQRPYLDVIDWGAGIAPDIVDFIFDPFFTTTPKGTGLGLYIAKELCEGNGATLEYHAGEGKVGSRFRVTFARPEDCLEFGTV